MVKPTTDLALNSSSPVPFRGMSPVSYLLPWNRSLVEGFCRSLFLGRNYDIELLSLKGLSGGIWGQVCDWLYFRITLKNMYMNSNYLSIKSFFLPETLAPLCRSSSLSLDSGQPPKSCKFIFKAVHLNGTWKGRETHEMILINYEHSHINDLSRCSTVHTN